MRKLILISIGISGVILFADTSVAETLASWDVNGVEMDIGTGISESSSPYTFNADTLGTHINSATLTLGSGVNPTTSANQYGFKIGADAEQTTLTGAIANNHFWEIAIEADSGYQADFSIFDMNAQASGTGADAAAFMSSAKGSYASGNEIATVTDAGGATGCFDTDPSGFGEQDLSGDADFQNLSGTTTFRIYGWGTTSGAGTTYIRNLSGSDLTISGVTEVIPEPTTFALVALLGAATLLRRKLFQS